jgi:hypothetical protein
MQMVHGNDGTGNGRLDSTPTENVVFVTACHLPIVFLFHATLPGMEFIAAYNTIQYRTIPYDIGARQHPLLSHTLRVISTIVNYHHSLQHNNKQQTKNSNRFMPSFFSSWAEPWTNQLQQQMKARTLF